MKKHILFPLSIFFFYSFCSRPAITSNSMEKVKLSDFFNSDSGYITKDDGLRILLSFNLTDTIDSITYIKSVILGINTPRLIP